jgi:hypothetical protein
MTLETYLSDFATYLKDRGLGVTEITTSTPDTTTRISISGYHDADLNFIFITPYQGADIDELDTGEADDIYPSVQFLVRNADQTTALSISNTIYRMFRKLGNTTIGTTEIIYMRASGPPAFVMKTNGGFYQYSINFLLRFSPD